MNQPEKIITDHPMRFAIIGRRIREYSGWKLQRNAAELARKLSDTELRHHLEVMAAYTQDVEFLLQLLDPEEADARGIDDTAPAAGAPA